MKAHGYIHIRKAVVGGKSPTGGITAAWFRDFESQQIIVAFAKCHEDDLYNKRVGREIAEKRIESVLAIAVEDRVANAEKVPYVVTLTLAEFKQYTALQLSQMLEVDTVQSMIDVITLKDIKNQEIIKFAEYISVGG